MLLQVPALMKQRECFGDGQQERTAREADVHLAPLVQPGCAGDVATIASKRGAGMKNAFTFLALVNAFSFPIWALPIAKTAQTVFPNP